MEDILYLFLIFQGYAEVLHQAKFVLYHGSWNKFLFTRKVGKFQA
jgi:hypothetical protein